MPLFQPFSQVQKTGKNRFQPLRLPAVTERHVGRIGEPTLRDLSEAFIAVYGTDYGVHSPIWIARFNDAARRPPPIATGGSCWRATPRTCITQLADKAPISAFGML